MHATNHLGSFLALRANGWSLAKISKELAISKSTLWEWDQKHQPEIHLLKHLQLEKLQEKFLPTYEEDLSRLRDYLDRIEAALAQQDFTQMGPEFLLQTALQLRTRFTKMREQVPLRPVQTGPVEPLPYTGCVSRQNVDDFKQEFQMGETPEPKTEPQNVIVPLPGQPHLNGHSSPDDQNRTFPDEMGGGRKLDASVAST